MRKHRGIVVVNCQFGRRGRIGCQAASLPPDAHSPGWQPVGPSQPSWPTSNCASFSQTDNRRTLSHRGRLDGKLLLIIYYFYYFGLTTCEIFRNRPCMKGHQSMHRTISRRTQTSPTIGGNGIAGSDTNQLNLQFVVKYREAAKHKQKVFETEDEAIQFARTQNPNFRPDTIQETEAQAS